MGRPKKQEPKKQEAIKFTSSELDAIVQIKEFRKICEANVSAILWKRPDLYLLYDNINLDWFIHNEWKVYWQIGYDLVVKEKKVHLDETTVDLYLEKHKKLKEKYEEYGGLATIEAATEIVSIKNADGYVGELNKWNKVMEMIRSRFPIAHRLKDYVDMTLDEIYEENEAMLNHIFVKNNEFGNIKSYGVADGIYKLIDKMDEGDTIGLPYYELNLLNHETNGLSLGNMYLWLGASGAGKSTIVRSTILPSIIKHDEKVVFMINEEDKDKVQKELLIWTLNNALKIDYQKYKLSKGKYSTEMKELLLRAAKWIESHNDKIIIVELDSFSADKAIKLIKKYSALGVKYFILDTFKHDAGISGAESAWLSLQLNAVKMFDTIKPAAKNVCLICTMQLTKQSTKQRCLTLENISSAKNVVDVAAGCYMIRWVLPDEYEGEKNEIKVFRKQGASNIPVRLDKNKRYQILFLAKNRFGTSNEFCIVLEADLSRNIYKEIGMTIINPDW